MERQMDRHHLSRSSSCFIREDPGHSAELNKKRKSLCDHTDLESSVSKQKLENQQVMELAESSENSMSYLFTDSVYNVVDPSMVPDWPCTSSSSYSNEATSCSTFGSSSEFDSGASTDNFGSLGMNYNCKKELFKELEALRDPVITELVKNSMEGFDADTDEDTVDSMLYSNGFDELATQSTLGGTMQDGRPISRQLTIDQEFEQYFSKLML